MNDRKRATSRLPALLVTMGAIVTSSAVYGSTGSYVGLNLARALNTDRVTILPGHAPASDPRVKLFNGYRMTQSLSIEGHTTSVPGYGRPGPALLTSPTPGISILGLSAVGRYAVTPDFSLRGRLGLVSIRSRDGLEATGLKLGLGNPGIQPFLGLGLEYRLTPAWTMRTTYDLFSIREGNRTRQMSVDLNYGF